MQKRVNIESLTEVLPAKRTTRTPTVQYFIIIQVEYLNMVCTSAPALVLVGALLVAAAVGGRELLQYGDGMEEGLVRLSTLKSLLYIHVVALYR